MKAGDRIEAELETEAGAVGVSLDLGSFNASRSNGGFLLVGVEAVDLSVLGLRTETGSRRIFRLSPKEKKVTIIIMVITITCIIKKIIKE